MSDKLVSFVIPCYRSEKTLEGVVDEIRDTISKLDGYDYESFWLMTVRRILQWMLSDLFVKKILK